MFNLANYMLNYILKVVPKTTPLVFPASKEKQYRMHEWHMYNYEKQPFGLPHQIATIICNFSINLIAF